MLNCLVNILLSKSAAVVDETENTLNFLEGIPFTLRTLALALNPVYSVFTYKFDNTMYFTHAHVHANAHTCIQMCMHTQTHTHAHTHTHTHLVGGEGPGALSVLQEHHQENSETSRECGGHFTCPASGGEQVLSVHILRWQRVTTSLGMHVICTECVLCVCEW